MSFYNPVPDDDHRISVTEWCHVPPPPMDGKGAPSSANLSWILGLLGTLLLHAVAVSSLRFTFIGDNNPPATETPITVARGSVEGPLILLAPIAPAARWAGAIDGVRPDRQIPIDMPLLITPPPALEFERLVLDDEEPSPAADNRANSDLERAQEIYERQIMARIERIWQRPREEMRSRSDGESDNNDPVFRCQAHLEQDDRGFVVEVLLPRCSGSPAWRESLLIAIRQASPLPAPPDARVFRSSLVLHFEGSAFTEPTQEAH